MASGLALAKSVDSEWARLAARLCSASGQTQIVLAAIHIDPLPASPAVLGSATPSSGQTSVILVTDLRLYILVRHGIIAGRRQVRHSIALLDVTDVRVNPRGHQGFYTTQVTWDDRDDPENSLDHGVQRLHRVGLIAQRALTEELIVLIRDTVSTLRHNWPERMQVQVEVPKEIALPIQVHRSDHDAQCLLYRAYADTIGVATYSNVFAMFAVTADTLDIRRMLPPLPRPPSSLDCRALCLALRYASPPFRVIRAVDQPSLGDAAVAQIMWAIGSKSSVEEIDFSDVGFGRAALTALCNALDGVEQPTLTRLILFGAKVNTAWCMGRLCECLSHSTRQLQWIDLAGTNLGDKLVLSLQQNLLQNEQCCRYMQYLNLSVGSLQLRPSARTLLIFYVLTNCRDAI